MNPRETGGTSSAKQVRAFARGSETLDLSQSVHWCTNDDTAS